MRWAEICDGVVCRITVSVDESTGADWLSANVGGEWVEVPADVVAGPGFLYSDGEFVAPEADV